MRIHLMSDLHLEFSKGKMRDYTPPECDVVILAGDIATGVYGVLWAQATFKVPVLYVPGNHEFYGKRIMSRHLEKMQAKAAGSHVAVLNRGAVFGDGVRFLGATMWTDFGLYGTEHVSQMVAQTEMNDYESIYTAQRKFLTADDTRSLHLESKFWLNEQLREPFDGKTVIITHHAPSELSVAGKYKNDPCNPAYASRLENIMLDHDPVLWVHGHVHDSADYEIGDTRVVCNPRGYVGHHLNPNFDPALVLEI